MEIRILGSLEVLADDGRAVPLGKGRHRALLAVLLLHANEVVSSDRLVDELWGERPPETAHKVLQGYVSRIRRALAPEEALVTQPPGYVLRVDPGRVDAARFEQLAREGSRALAAGAAEEAAETLSSSLSLWRGPALAEFAFDDFAQAEIRRLEDLRLAALEDRIEAELALGLHTALVPELESLVAEHPLRERLLGQLMLALYRSGRQAEALAAFQTARRTLVEELGLDPSDGLRGLERGILTHDASLAAPRRRGRTGAKSARRRLLAVAAALLAAAAVATTVTVLAWRSGGSHIVVAPNSLALIDSRTNDVVAQVPVGARPLAVEADARSVWVANADDGTVSRIDPPTRKVVKTLGIGAPAIDIALGDDAVWVAGGTDGTLALVDPHTNAVVETLDLRGSNDLAPNGVYAVATGQGSLWVASGSGTILRIDPVSSDVLAQIAVGPVPSTVALGEGAVWAAHGGGRLVRIEPATNSVTATVSVRTPSAVAVGAGAVWVADGDHSIWRIDPATTTVIASMRVGNAPVAIAVDDAVWVANSGDGTVTRIDPATNDVVETIDVGHAPSDIAVADGAVWVSVASAT